MTTRPIHFAYVALLIILTVTVITSFPFSLYLFATMKASIIFVVFMQGQRSESSSKLYMFLALVLLVTIVGGTLDDVLFR